MNIYELETMRKRILQKIEKIKAYLIFAIVIYFIFLIFVWYMGNRDINAVFVVIAFSAIAIIKTFKNIEFFNKKYLSSKIFFALLILLGLNSNTKAHISFILFIIIILCLAFGAIFGFSAVVKYMKNHKSKTYRRLFKERYLKPYIENFGYKYESDGIVETQHFYDSNLFFKSSTIFNANDKITGKFEGVDFEFCDIAFFATDEEKRVDTWGIFFYAKFNKKIKSPILVLTNKKQVVKNLKKITMDDSEFNAKFSVYSNNLQNAMYILSPAFMKRLLDLKRRLNFPISVSFVGDKIYIFLDTGKDNFEPDIDKSVLHANPAFTIKRELSHFLSIVKTLNLNTKIWKV